MRTRKQIEDDAKRYMYKEQNLILEVLLDIRDLLQKKEREA